MLTSILVLLASALSVVAQGEGGPEGRETWEGVRVKLPAIPEASWCESGVHVLDLGTPVQVGSVTMELHARGVRLQGRFKAQRAARKRGKHKPSKFKVKSVGGVEKPALKELRGADLSRKAVEVELFDDTLTGIAVIRIERTWRGHVWGVVTGRQFKLAGETLTVVDADLDGVCSAGDMVIYGNRNLWMPWHTVTSGGGFIYHDMKIAGPNSITAMKMKMEDPGVDRRVWEEWQKERKNQGVPPGVFSALRQRYCVKHAEYLKLNPGSGHSEDPDRRGYSEGGHDAGMSSCISYSGGAEAMWGNMNSLYHRPQLIDPRNVGLQLGGTGRIFLMGYGSDPDLPTESRQQSLPQLHPAPGTSYPDGSYTLESPSHPALSADKGTLGLPIIARLPSYSPDFSNVTCKLFRVSGGMRTGRRRHEIPCHLSHKGTGTPRGFPNMWGMIALTPYSALKGGVYEARFAFTAMGREHDRQWRFEIK